MDISFNFDSVCGCILLCFSCLSAFKRFHFVWVVKWDCPSFWSDYNNCLFYQCYKKNQKEIEIVFRSADKTEKAMLSYIKKDKMKWLAVPFGKQAKSKSASGIPHLVVYSPDGKVFAEISGAGERSFNALDELPKLMKKWKEENK